MAKSRDAGETRPLGDAKSAGPRSPGGKPGAGPAARAAARAAFRSGDLASGRFRIERYLDRGGMGEVYEATDLELGERVALKTIRPEIANDPGAVDRLKREIQLARKITHPGICRLFDFWIHPGRGRARPIAFVTMELLTGERLDERMRREGRLLPEAALPLAREMIAALAAAHRAGVLHLDLKPPNVYLASRLVVTDFGIAAAVGSAVVQGDAPASWGTPGYMAPEQAAGLPPTPAADLYAFGVVLYEMLFQQRPIDESREVFEARRAELPPRVSATLRRCLAEDPDERPSEAGDVLEALAPIAVASTNVVRPTPAGATDRSWFTLWSHGRSMPQSDEAAAAYRAGLEELRTFRPEAAVPHFEQAVALEPDFALAHSALAEALSAVGFETRAIEAARQAFLRSGQLTRVERVEVEARFRRLSNEWPRAIDLQRTLWVFEPSNRELGIALAATQLDAGRTADALETIAELRADGAPASADDPRIDLLEAEQAWCAADLTRQCAMAERAIASASRLSLVNIEARARFLLASGLFHLGTMDEAEAQFLHARRLWSGDARGTARTLRSLGLLYRTRGRPREAMECYEEALTVARAQGQRREAAGSISDLSTAYMALGDAATAERFCEEGLREHRELGNQRSVVRTLVMYAIILSTRGAFEEALAAYREALVLSRQLDDPMASLMVLQNLANACSSWGRYAEAHRHAEESLRFAEAVGDPARLAHSRVFGAFSLVAWGRLAEAEAEVALALQTFAEVGDLVRLASSRLLAAQIAMLMGRLDEARAQYTLALQESERLDRPQFTGWALAGLGEVAFWAGDLQEARVRLEEALRLRQELNEEWSLAESFYLLALVDCADGRIDESLLHLDESRQRAIRFARRDDEALADSLAAHCHLALGDLVPADTCATRARKTASLSESLITRFWIDLHSAEVESALGRHHEARERLLRAIAFAERSGAKLLAAEGTRVLQGIRQE